MRKEWLPVIVLVPMLLLTALLAAAARISYEWGVDQARRQRTSTQSLSPDGRHQVILKEQFTLLDRNFEVLLEDMQSGKRAVLFHSPDEGAPGTERFLWSADSRYFLLLGRHFYVVDGSSLSDGEQLYLLCHVPDRRIWCNSGQAHLDRFDVRTLARLGLGDIPRDTIPMDDSMR